MECFIIEKGVERKAELEDILPMIDGIGAQYIFRDSYETGVLPYAIAHLPDEMKKLVFKNLLSRIRGRIEKEVDYVESMCKNDDNRIQNAREILISSIGENKRSPFWYSGRVVWKETKPKEPANPVEKLIYDIEEACASGDLSLFSYNTNKISGEDLKNIFASFKDRKNELLKIRSLKIAAGDLPAAVPLFEAGGIDKLEIDGEFDGKWPEFLENYRNLTSINLTIRKGLTEFPSWIRNAVSMRRLSISYSNITLLPDWIGELQSLTELDIHYGNHDIKALPETICNLKNLAKLTVYGSGLEKLPDSIGDLSSLKELMLSDIKNLTSLPESIGNLKNLAKLKIYNSPLEKLPDSIGNLSSLEELSMHVNYNLTSLPDSIGNLKNLVNLSVYNSGLEKLPDSIGGLSSLKELHLYGNKNLTSLPDSIGNLSNLNEITLHCSYIKTLPDSIGNLQNLAKLSMLKNKIFSLPDSIGRLKNLTTLNLCGTCIEELPDTITDCSSLECLDICKTKITSFPASVSSIKNLKRTIEVIPKKRCISYLSFCNYYYSLADTIIKFSIKAEREGLLSWEEEMDSISEGFFKDGIRLALDADDEEDIKHFLALKIEHERDYYKKKLMEIALEGILFINRRESIRDVVLKLAAMVDIKNNPLDIACAKYLAGDYDAFDDIDFKAAIQPEEEREEIRFLKRSFEISERNRREGIIGIEKLLDNNGIAAKDVFEYGISLLVVGLDYKDIDKYLTMLIDRETDPARKNLSLAKKEAVRMIYEGNSPELTKKTLLTYFDDEVAEGCSSESDED